MKKYLLIIGLLIVSFSLQAQTTVYNGTRIFTGIFRIAAGAQFDFKGNYIVDSQLGDTLATVEGMRTVIQQYISNYEETDPIYSNDSSKLVMWSDTLNKIVTVKRLIDSLENVYDQIALKLNITDTIKLHNQIITKLAITDTAKLHNQIATKQPQLSGTGFVKASGTTITYDNSTYQPAGSYVLTSDTARYISKSQARKDIHDSIAPLRTDVTYLMNLNYTDSYSIPSNDTVRIKVGNIFEDDGIFIQRYIIKDSLGHKVMGENLNILTDINALTIDYGKYITNYTLNYDYSFVIDTDLESIYWVFVNKNNFGLTLKYYKNPLKF